MESGGSASGIGTSPDGEYAYAAGESDQAIGISKRLVAGEKPPLSHFSEPVLGAILSKSDP
jgi:hypothetical protein